MPHTKEDVIRLVREGEIEFVRSSSLTFSAS